MPYRLAMPHRCFISLTRLSSTCQHVRLKELSSKLTVSERTHLLRQLSQRWSAAVNLDLLDLALTHPSIGEPNNDQLEFLGDSVLQFIVVEFLYQRYGDHAVGELAELRSALLSNAFWIGLAQDLALDQLLVTVNPLAHTSKSLADALEAVVGALYLSWQGDDWRSRLQDWLHPHLQAEAESLLATASHRNPKNRLQEYTQARDGSLPEYRSIATTTADAHYFTAEVWIEGEKLGEGQGKNRRAAEVAAATEALAALEPQAMAEAMAD